MSSGRIYFSYQNPGYKTIVDILYFTVKNKQEAIDLINEALRILEMEKTDRDQDIRHTFAGVSMVRYGFQQKAIIIHEFRGTKFELVKILSALENYQYQQKINLPE